MYTNADLTKRQTGFLGGRSAAGRGGFSLVEVTMAMGLVAFCLVAMLGVLPVGLAQERRSLDQLTASQVLAAVGNDFQIGGNGTGETAQYRIPVGVGSDGSFFVDQSFQYTSQAADAEHQVWYRINGVAGSPEELRMHLFIARAQPGQTSGQLAQGQTIAEGIVQKRVN